VALSADGNTALVGSQGNNQYTGAAYVFVRGGDSWSQQQELTASGGATNDYFGYSVALSADGSTALVGAYGVQGFTGAAYVFGRGSSWSQQQKLTASDGAIHDDFGYSVALSGDGSTALVGTPLKNGSTGTAYMFVRPGGSWDQQQELTANDGVANDYLGYSVALSGDGNTALVGAPLRNGNTGAAYVFALNGGSWDQQQELTANDGAVADSLGYSVALSSDGNTALIGAFGANNATGAAYVFVHGGSWRQEQELVANDGAVHDDFGAAVTLSGDGSTALVGAFGIGAAYLFMYGSSGWNQQQELIASNGAANDDFGRSTALSGDGSTALVGAYGAIKATGAAYVFGTPTYPPTTTATFAPVPNGSGWNNSTVTVTLTTTNDTGVSEQVVSHYAVDNVACAPGNLTACSTYIGPFSVSGEGRHTLYFFSVANVLNVEPRRSVPVNIDQTAPHTAVSLSGLATGAGSYLAPVTVTLSATDTLSGLARTMYQLDGGASQPYTGPFTLTATGRHTVTVSSTDRAGNVEVPHTTSVTIVRPTLHISPPSGSTQQTVALTGTNFAAREIVLLYGDRIGSTPIYTATATRVGTFAIQRGVLPGPYGRHTIIAVGQRSGQSASAPFFITPAAYLAASSGQQGTLDTLAGTGFAAGETVNAVWIPGGIGLGSATASPAGSVTLTFTVPISPSSGYTIAATGAASQATATSPFTLTPALAVGPTNGPAGSVVRVAGTGYGAQETVSVRWDCTSPNCSSTTVLGQATTDANGNFPATLMTIPATAPFGAHTLGGLGATSRAFGSAVFTVTP
jgi:hypothetical protein